ncbi:MAG TPA: polysaccharide biosynthesis protein, partial [Candidatus Defluviicoccus seviourii]|nr:polysaccharide biosynthesis protein [Candidatus Defluviicoccus seviourii]
QMRRIVETCKACRVPYKTLPGIGEIIDGRVSIKALRDVNYEDLLGRSTVQLDMEEIQGYLKGKSVLVTGCGGSIGAELCRQIVRFQPQTLILVDASEANLFYIELALRNELRFDRCRAVLGRIQDEKLMTDVFERYHPQVVFHAAAYKHVPMLENNPWEAVFNNILGSRVIMEIARRNGTERFVFVSTDKAVRPTNVMGASKRVTELYLQAFEETGPTRFMAVRFGNVVGSSGSVIPVFLKQIEQGGPVTVTHPEVARYFMTIPEACQLILQAGAMGEGGEIFLLKMGKPVRIADMARDLIRLSGREPDDVKIIFTGLRQGEKLYEELITSGEGVVPTGHDKIMVLRAASRSDAASSPDEWMARLDAQLTGLYAAAERFDAEWGIDRSYASRGGLKPAVDEDAPRRVYLLQRKSSKVGDGLAKTTGWIRRTLLKKRGVAMIAGVDYKAINDAGLHITINGEPKTLAVDTVVVCAGQEPRRDLFAPLQAAGVPVTLIGGADVAAELDAKRAIDQGTRVAAGL